MGADVWHGTPNIALITSIENELPGGICEGCLPPGEGCLADPFLCMSSDALPSKTHPPRRAASSRHREVSLDGDKPPSSRSPRSLRARSIGLGFGKGC